MAALSYCAKDNHVFLTIFIACQCKVQRVVARKWHPSLLCAGKYYAWATKCPHTYGNETPVWWQCHVDVMICVHGLEFMCHSYGVYLCYTCSGVNKFYKE